MKKIIPIFLLFIIPFAAVAQGNGGYTKEDGDKAYAESRFADAVTIYEGAIAEQGGSQPLYYNLGNAYYRINQPGKAILNYERALRMNPMDEDTRSNLEFVQSTIVDKIPQDEIPFFKEWADRFSSMLSKDNWGVIGIAAFAAMLVMLFIALFKSNLRKVSLAVAVIAFVIAAVANISAFNIDSKTDGMPEGVILDEMVVVKSSPDASGTELTKIHEGLKVVILDNVLSDWAKIEANNGNRVVGWVKKKSLEQI